MSKADLKFNSENTCPICGSNNIEYGTFELDSECGYYPCTCENCQATWQEVYKLTFNSVDEVFDGNDNKIYSGYDEIVNGEV